MKKFLCTILSFIIVAVPCIPLAGCSSSTIDTILQDLPVAVDIATSVINIVSPRNSQLLSEVTEYAGKVSGDLKLIESLINQYKANLSAAPAGVLAQVNAALNDTQKNLSAILAAVGVNDAKVTAAVAAAVDSVKLILSDVALLVKNAAPPAVTAQLFAGLGMPGVAFFADQQQQPKTQAGSRRSAGDALQNYSHKSSGKSCRQIAQDYNQKVGKDFPQAKVKVPKRKVLGIAVPF